MNHKRFLAWIYGIVATIITIYIFARVIMMTIHPQTIDWGAVKDIGAPFQITPLAILTLFDIILLACLIRYLSRGILNEPQ